MAQQQYKMKYFVKEPGEHVIGLASVHLTEMQLDGKCDACNKELPQGTRVLGKVVNTAKLFIQASRFSPTCMQCAGLN